MYKTKFCCKFFNQIKEYFDEKKLYFNWTNLEAK